MSFYAFVLGKTPLLSLAEILALFPEARLREISREAAILEGVAILEKTAIQKKIFAAEKVDIAESEKTESQKNAKIAALQNRLGGTIKIAEIVTECNFSKIAMCSAEVIDKIYQENFFEGKISYAINDYSGKKLPLKQILLETKKKLKSRKISSRFVNKNFTNVVGAATIGEKLIEKGIELNIFSCSGKFLIGKTLSIQDIDWYSQRDYERPARDAKSGMLPPKLAQIMINLAVGPEAGLPIIYDPFCGSGTILMEAALMNLRYIGSDISEKAVEDSRKNLAWLQEKMSKKIPQTLSGNFSQINFQSQQKKAEKISEKNERDLSLSNNIFIQDALKNFEQKGVNELFQNQKNINIVSEPYLGPALFSAPSEARIPFIQRELEDLLLAFFKNVHQQLSEIKTIVIIFPYIKTKTKRYFLKILQAIENIGYKPAQLIPDEFEKKVRLEFSSRLSLLYERPDQIVGREIFKFKRT